MEIKVAFALNNDNQFEKKHFGDADKFNIYLVTENSCTLLSEEKNDFKNLDEGHVHGSRKKGESIANFLKDKNVSTLVSKQFGANVKMIVKHFVPIIVNKESTEDVCDILIKHFKWVHEESQVQAEKYKLFILRSNLPLSE